MTTTRSTFRDVRQFVKELGIEFPVEPEDICMEKFSLFTKQQLQCFGFSELHCEKLLQGLATTTKRDTRAGSSRKQAVSQRSLKPKPRDTSARPAKSELLFALESGADVKKLLENQNNSEQIDLFINRLPSPSVLKRQEANSENVDIFASVLLGFDEKVAKLIEKNPKSVNTPNSDGWTPLHYAMAIGCTDIAVLLVNNGASMSAQNNTGETPIDSGAKWGHRSTLGRSCLRLVELYGKTKVEKWVNVRDENDRQPIHHAAESRHFEACNALLMFGADPNSKDKNGETALFLACKQADLATIEVLIHNEHNKKKSGDLHIPNNEGKSAYDVFPKEKSILSELMYKN